MGLTIFIDVLYIDIMEKGHWKIVVLVLNMSGNVWEWCFDKYDNNPASNDSAYEQGGIVTDPQGAASGSDRVLRGGSWDYDAYGCTVGVRNGFSPDRSYNLLGLRLACLP